jgi:hypothetical protein
LAVYQRVAGKYEFLPSENNRVWLPEIGLALGHEQGEHIACRSLTGFPRQGFIVIGIIALTLAFPSPKTVTDAG